MANENEVFSATGYFGGYKAKNNFDVEISFKFPSEQLADALQFLTGIGKKLNIIALVGEEKHKLGSFNLYDFKVNRDGGAAMKLKSSVGNCFVNNFISLSDEEVPIILKAKVAE